MDNRIDGEALTLDARAAGGGGGEMYLMVAVLRHLFAVLPCCHSVSRPIHILFGTPLISLLDFFLNGCIVVIFVGFYIISGAVGQRQGRADIDAWTG